MNNSTLKPLTKRELDRIETYCRRLGLNSWDINDIKAYFIVRRNISMLTPSFDYEYVNATEEFKKAKNKMFDLGIMNVAEEFSKYLTLEPQLFSENRAKYPNMTDEENWTLVYDHIDKIISQEITSAKKSAKEARGCAVTLVILILVPISLAIAISSIFFV
jgi:hypothetical protein